MGGQESLEREQYDQYNTLRIDVDGAATWCHMHAHSLPGYEPYRPCFSTRLLKELRDFQVRPGEVKRQSTGDSSGLKHLVLASAADVFNLGGDLDLFCRLIREQDRDSLMGYARQCIDVAYGFYRPRDENVHTIALVQGDALGGGFEAALCCQTLVAENGVGMGFPEVLFDLFPGMGAYSFLRGRVSAARAEEMMLDGKVYSSEELYSMGVVDVLAPRGGGIAVVQDVIARQRRIGHARLAMDRVKNLCHSVTLQELMTVTEIWVETALQLGEKSLRTMERLVRAQLRRPNKQWTTPSATIMALPRAG